MVVIRTSYNDLVNLIGKEITQDELERLLAFAKAEIDALEDDELQIDIKTSNRPDLWCAEGISREIRGILEKEKGIPKYEVKPSNLKVVVDEKLSETRPYIACAVAKKIKLSDYMIKQLMQLSEKIDLSYGRKRKRTSIGMYNLSMIKSPIEYKTVEKDYSFVPLGFEEKLTVEEILKKHPKGLEYGDIVKNYGLYPILISGNGMTLSMPPIINSNDVGRITEETTECLIEVTGNNYEAVNLVLNVLCQTFADRGAEIYSVDIVYPPKSLNQIISTPIIKPTEMEVDIKQISKYLGVKLTAKKVVSLLEKRRLNGEIIDNSKVKVFFPPYRADFLHWVDVAEEVAIALDYNKIGPTKWKVLTTGGLLPETESENLVRELLLGSGATEVLTYTLTDPTILSSAVNIKEENFVKVENPVSLTFSVLRNQLYPCLINLLSKNTHEPYPQKIFEVGEVVKLIDNRPTTQANACFMYADAEASFEDAHKLLHQLMKLLDVEYKLRETTHPSFIEGRTGDIIINGKTCGIIGEINPSILERNQIWVPVVGFEIELPLIPTLNCKRKFTY
ncbi:MAG: phenylalanine--tRNA ligase subunit beta [Candidatus Heimdallarchaeaceae archaeon]